MVSNVEPVVVKNSELCWANGCESLWAFLSLWVWIMVCYYMPVDVNHVCYAEPVVVNHGKFAEPVIVYHVCYADQNVCESWFIILSQLL
jgi:hypothetical protein